MVLNGLTIMHKKCRIIYMKILEHIKRIHIHKWEYILKENIGVFLGEKYIYYNPKFRICSKCKKAQEEFSYEITVWTDLSEEEKKILLRKIKYNNKLKAYCIETNIS